MSPEDRRDFLTDGRSRERREAFRRVRSQHEMTFLQFLRFCDSVSRLFPVGSHRPEPSDEGWTFLL